MTAIARSAPPATERSRIPVNVASRDRPPVRGLIRSPASRSSGAATSAIDGSAGRSSSSSQSRVGLTLTVGVGAASRICRMGAGGCL